MEFNLRRFYGVILVIVASLALSSCVSVPEAPGSAPVASLPTAPPALAEVAPPPRDLPPLIEDALAALDAHSAEVPHHDRIGVVDFSLPSSQPRFYIVDVATGRIEGSWLVAHGSGSDPAGTGIVQSFSNQPGSNASARPSASITIIVSTGVPANPPSSSAKGNAISPISA